MNDTTERVTDAGPLTLAIDIGGSHLKAGVLNPQGAFATGPARVVTPSHATPEAVVSAIVKMIQPLGAFDRISIGFPGVVRRGVVWTAPNLDTAAWRGFPLASSLTDKFAKPTRMLNDAEVQGLGVITRQGLECAITLGTGMGFALFENGMPAPHLELSHHPIHKDKTYDQFIGNRALREVGANRWNRRVRRAIGCIEQLVGYDTLYIGGGNARHLTLTLASNVRIVSNQAGITGGVRLWDHSMDRVFSTR